ncbi:TNF receptor-associated factor 4-like [Haemaphysalis longicornis]
MAHGSDEFVLVGYSEALERRPLKFVDPIPATLICSACGHIPRLTFSLLCGHVLCEPCYQSSATTSECVCPLDGDVSGADHVTSKKYPPDNQLKRKVHCWNEANGCRVVLPASHVAEHVRTDCQHHVTRCPTCSAVVLTLDVCAHLKSRCTALVFLAASDPQQRTDNKEQRHVNWREDILATDHGAKAGQSVFEDRGGRRRAFLTRRTLSGMGLGQNNWPGICECQKVRIGRKNQNE